jgi:hypothetical protein
MSEQADRYNVGKLKWSYIHWPSMEELVKVLMYGANKYAPNNWKKGLSMSEISESLLRHLFAFMEGEDTDPESGESHIGHIMCNVMFMNYVYKFKPEFDDR